MTKGLVDIARPVYEMPRSVPLVGRLGDQIGKDKIEAVGKLAGQYGGSNDILVPFKHQNGEVIQSNLYGAILMNVVLGDEGAKIASLASLEAAQMAYDADNSVGLNGRGIYRDLGIVLRKGKLGRNASLAPTLVDELGKMDKGLAKLGVPIVIPVSSLMLEQNSGMPDGYALHIKKDGFVIEAPQLIAKNHNIRFSKVDVKTGLPILGEEQGSRILYTSEDALSRLFLSGYLDLVSGDEDLAYSSSYGRVDFELGEVDAQNFARIANARVNANIRELQTQYDSQVKTGQTKIDSIRKELGL